MRILRNGMIWQLSFIVGSFSDFPNAIHVVRFNDVGMLQSSAQGAAVTVLYHLSACFAGATGLRRCLASFGALMRKLRCRTRPERTRLR